ncbi:MAG TPA: Stp1/IreP family PP2C-type Ser/Thr phosphatase [Gaiellaceae bacterium]|nr:Stp1/IreP family PP2C-type Ser/Thr phosphatase [Gaiellaceae bacterium]
MPVAQYAVASDTGRKRRRNEDNYVVEPPLFAVADGMGGAQAGEVASKLAASALEGGAYGAGGLERVESLIQEANRRVYDRATTDPAASGMGTTMTVALVEGMTVVIGHVGDSRAYLLRGERMEQLTDDHSLVNELLKSGKLSEEEAQIHPQRSVITRAVGTDPDVDVDAYPVDAEEGDIFLLCSDGLTDMVDDEDILDVLYRHRKDLDRAVRALVSAANRGGGEDNITVIAFRVSGDATGEETMRMPALEPEEQTREAVPQEPAVDTMVIPPERIEAELLDPDSAAARAAARDEPPGVQQRVRLLLTMLVLLAVAAALLVWGLLR